MCLLEIRPQDRFRAGGAASAGHEGIPVVLTAPEHAPSFHSYRPAVEATREGVEKRTKWAGR